MFAHEVGGGLETLIARDELAFGLQEVDEVVRGHVIRGAGVETGVGPKVGDNIGPQAFARVGLAGLQHHLNDFMSVNLFHARILTDSDSV